MCSLANWARGSRSNSWKKATPRAPGMNGGYPMAVINLRIRGGRLPGGGLWFHQVNAAALSGRAEHGGREDGVRVTGMQHRKFSCWSPGLCPQAPLPVPRFTQGAARSILRPQRPPPSLLGASAPGASLALLVRWAGQQHAAKRPGKERGMPAVERPRGTVWSRNIRPDPRRCQRGQESRHACRLPAAMVAAARYAAGPRPSAPRAGACQRWGQPKAMSPAA
jgi:hypothetical protein